MASVMTKRGSQDNVVTYEFFCDTEEDLNNIDPRYITMGSVAVIIDGFEVYIANSKKEWINFASSSNTTLDGNSSSKVNEGQADYMIVADDDLGT